MSMVNKAATVRCPNCDTEGCPGYLQAVNKFLRQNIASHWNCRNVTIILRCGDVKSVRR